MFDDQPGRHAAPERPEPVKEAAKLGALLAGFFVACGGVVAIFLAGFTLDDLGPLGFAVGAAITAGTALAAGLASYFTSIRARAKVTPLAAPRNDDGRPLMVVPGLSDGPTP
jgi:hypothetical protein